MQLLAAHMADFLVELRAHLPFSLNFRAVHLLYEPLNALLFAEVEDKVVGDRHPVGLVLLEVDVVDEGHVACSCFLYQCQVRLDDRCFRVSPSVSTFSDLTVR